MQIKMWNKKLAGDYNSLRDTHLAHYFSRQDVLKHLVNMGLVTRAGEIVPETEWRKLYARQQRLEKEREDESHRMRLLEAEEAAKRRVKQKIRRREAQLVRQPSASEPDLVHFDIEWSFRPVSVTTEGAQTSSETQGTSSRTSDTSRGTSKETSSPSDEFSGDSNHSNRRHQRAQLRLKGISENSPDLMSPEKKSHKYPTKPQFIERGGMVGEPYFASLGPNPSPKYIHIIKPTNSCREVWTRLCPPQPICTRPPRPPSPPYLRLEYARGGAPCYTPTDLALLQQPAGSHNVTVFHGVVQEGDEIEFTSLRRENFPFSLTIYEHGVTTGRLSACCEHRYAPGSRLGGPSGHLKVLDIVGGEPCLRCQLRSVEKRHHARQKNLKSKDCPTQSHTLPGEDGNKTENLDEDVSSSSNSCSKNQSKKLSCVKFSQEQIAKDISLSKSVSNDYDSSDSSTDIEGDSQGLKQSLDRRSSKVCTTSSDSCNGPSDYEVAAVLGVTVDSSQSPKKFQGRRKLSVSSETSASESHMSRKSTKKQLDDDHKHNFISSSLEVHLDDNIEGRIKSKKKSKVAFCSRQASPKRQKRRSSKCRGERGKNGDFRDQTKVDSFYSQQTFTSSASEAQDASRDGTEASYGSSWEEDEDSQKDVEGKSDGKESASAKEENMDTEGEHERTISSEVEDEVSSTRDTVKGTDDENEEIHSEVPSESGNSSKDGTIIESEKCEGDSVSEEVGDDSDIVSLAYSEEEIMEENERVVK